LIGSIFSIVVLFADRDESFEIRSSSVGSGGFRKSSLIDSSDTAMSLNFTPVDFNRIEQLDSLSYRSITVGFLLLTVGLISGAVWANEAWGNWWSWDPKETWALICWLVYAAYLHTRISRGWQGRKSAILASIGLLIISICYIGVNLLGVGLHSYGWFF
jgi:cytochrome c-type biogenesis protein CcsB